MRPGAARPAGAHGAHGLTQAHAQRLRPDLVGDELRAGDHVREHVADDGGRGLIERLAVVLRRLAELAAQNIGRVAPEPRDDRGVKALDTVRPAVSTQGGERQRAQAAVIMSALDLEQQRHAAAEGGERLGKRRDDAVGIAEAQGAQLGEREIINDARHAAHALERIVVEHDELVVRRQVHVHLDGVARLGRGTKGRERIFRHGAVLGVQAAVRIVAVHERGLLRARGVARRDEKRKRTRAGGGRRGDLAGSFPIHNESSFRRRGPPVCFALIKQQFLLFVKCLLNCRARYCRMRQIRYRTMEVTL